MKIAEQIGRLKRERGAVLLAHFYQLPEVQDVADIVGDSLELAKAARNTDAEVIVFCGVRFMAETAKILNPAKSVLLPVPDAGCPMADMITAGDVRALRAAHPEAAVLCYVNSDLGVKAESDVCCTSSNVLRVAKSLPNREIIFVPDQCLGGYVARRLPEKEFILPRGFCPTHCRIKAEDVLAARAARPDARLLVHPECAADVAALADFTGSTAQIIAEAARSGAREFLIGTEEGILHRLKKLCPDKRFYSVGPAQTCPDMKKTRLADVLASLEGMRHRVEVDSALARRAVRSLDRMFAVSA